METPAKIVNKFLKNLNSCEIVVGSSVLKLCRTSNIRFFLTEFIYNFLTPTIPRSGFKRFAPTLTSTGSACVTSWGGDYADLTLTYSFDPKKIADISLNDEEDKKRGNKAFLFAITLDGNNVEVVSDQGGDTKRKKDNIAVFYIMMKGSEGYVNYDELEGLFGELYEAS